MLNASNSITPNLYAYCDNDPVNNFDLSGDIVWKELAKIVLQVLSNILKQFFEDVIMFLSKLIFRGPKTKFELNPKNYAEAALEAILDYFKPFSKMKRALSDFILSTLKTMAGQIVDCIRGKPFDIGSIINETFVSALKSLVLGNADKKELEYLRQHCDDIDEVLYLEK